MSAKSSNFAGEKVENMDIKDYTHTCYRCAHSCYIGGRVLRCPVLSIDCKPNEVTKCRRFEHTQCAKDFFSGLIKGTHAVTLYSIYTGRVKNGTF